EAALADYRNVFFREDRSFGGAQGDQSLCRVYLKLNQLDYAQDACRRAAQWSRGQDIPLPEALQTANFLLSKNELKVAFDLVTSLMADHASDPDVQKLRVKVTAGLCAIGSPDCKSQSDAGGGKN